MSPQAGFLLQDQIVPRLQSAIPAAVPSIGCEDAQELVQDATCMAARMMHNAELAGKKLVRSASSQVKQGKQVTAGNIAYYVIIKLRNGCRSSGMVTADVYGSGTQIMGRCRLNSLNEVVSYSESDDENFELQDLISQDEEDPFDCPPMMRCCGTLSQC